MLVGDITGKQADLEVSDRVPVTQPQPAFKLRPESKLNTFIKEITGLAFQLPVGEQVQFIAVCQGMGVIQLQVRSPLRRMLERVAVNDCPAVFIQRVPAGSHGACRQGQLLIIELRLVITETAGQDHVVGHGNIDVELNAVTDTLIRIQQGRRIGVAAYRDQLHVIDLVIEARHVKPYLLEQRLVADFIRHDGLRVRGGHFGIIFQAILYGGRPETGCHPGIDLCILADGKSERHVPTEFIIRQADWIKRPGGRSFMPGILLVIRIAHPCGQCQLVGYIIGTLSEDGPGRVLDFGNRPHDKCRSPGALIL